MVAGRMNFDDSSVEVASLPENLARRFVNEHVQISTAARHALGLDPATADRLFRSGNDLDNLRELVEEICAGTGAQPEPEGAAAG
jgi:hypothetical protein